MSVHLTSVRNGVVQVTQCGTLSVEVATTRHLVGEADIQECFEKEGSTDGRAKWSRGLSCGSEGARFLGLWVRIPSELQDVCLL
jgi:hypothetical protein